MEFLLPVFLNAVLPLAGALVSGLISWGAAAAVKYVRQKTQNEAIHDAMGHVAMTVETVVKEIEQTLAVKIKGMAADGKLSEDEATALKQIAVDKVREQVPPAMQEIAAQGTASLERFIDSKIEAAVGDLKRLKGAGRKE